MKPVSDELVKLEMLAEQDTFVHKCHPAIKIAVTLLFIIAAVSGGRYDLARPLALLAYPWLLATLSATPLNLLHRRFIWALPFPLFAGIANVIFEQNSLYIIGGISISFGLVSLIVLILKTYLTVMAVFILLTTTRWQDISAILEKCHIPSLFCNTLTLIYRYLSVLTEEAWRMYHAYLLRAPRQKGIRLMDMGPFCGQLVLQSYDRASRLYAAMKCRGWTTSSSVAAKRPLASADLLYLFCSLCFVLALVVIF